MAARLAFFYAAVFLFIGVLVPFWPVWLGARGLAAAEIGIVLSVATWVRACVPPFIAHAADRRGERKRVLVVLTSGTLCAYTLFSFVEGFWSVLGVTALAAMFFGAVIPLGENLSMLVTQARGIDYGRVRLWGSITFIAAAIIGGALLEGRSESLILWLVLSALALCVFSAVGLPDTRPPASAGGRPPVALLLRNRLFIGFILAMGLIQASHATLYGFATLHWRAAGISDDAIGLLWGEGVLAEIVLFAFSGAVVARLGPKRLLVLAAFAGILRWVVLANTTSIVVLLIVQPLHALTFGAAHLAAMHFLTRAVPPEYSATAQSLYTGLGVGIFMGMAMIASGWLYGAFAGNAFYAMAAMTAVSAFGLIFLSKRWNGDRLPGLG